MWSLPSLSGDVPDLDQPVVSPVVSLNWRMILTTELPGKLAF